MGSAACACSSCGGTRRFVVIGAQRTGINILREILNTNDEIAMLGEVFSPSGAPAHWENFLRLRRSRFPPANAADAEALLDEYFEFVEYRIRHHWAGNAKSKCRAVGIDIKYDQFPPGPPPHPHSTAPPIPPSPLT